MFMKCVAGGFSDRSSASFRSNFFRNRSAPLGHSDIRWISSESLESTSTPLKHNGTIRGADRRGRVVSWVTYTYERTQRLKQRLSGSDHSIVAALE